VALSADEARANEQMFNRLRTERATPPMPIHAQVTGLLVRKMLPFIFRQSDGVYVGNGFGQAGGYPALLVIRTIHETP